MNGGEEGYLGGHCGHELGRGGRVIRKFSCPEQLFKSICMSVCPSFGVNCDETEIVIRKQINIFVTKLFCEN